MKAALLALAALLPAPQGWEPFTPRRESSPAGRHYAVFRAVGEPVVVKYELCRRRDGASPLPPARGEALAGPRPPVITDIGRDLADPLVVAGDLPQPPYQVAVLDREPALVLFEKYGALGKGDAVALLGADGKIRWRHALADLFKADAIRAFPVERGDTWWFEAWWVDEERGTVVICPVGDQLGEIALSDGKVRRGDPAALLARAAAGPAADRVAAMEIAARMRPEGTAALAKRLAADGKEPLDLRVRAAAALHRSGGTMEFAPLLREASAAGAPPRARSYAASVLAEILGEASLPLLRDLLRGEAGECWRPAMASLASLGEKAVPVLLEMLGEKDQSLDYRGGAATVLGAMKAETALPALWKAAEAFDAEKDPFHFVPQSALAACVAMEPADLRARMLALLGKATPHDGRVAQWFEAHPAGDALPALRAALARWEKSEYGKFAWEYKRIEAAIRACGG